MLLCRTRRTRHELHAPCCQTCGRPLTALIQGGLVAGRFEIQAVIGSGGQGIVYRAYDRSLEEDVALKVLRPEFASTEETAKRFLQEIKLARKVTDRHVCRIFEYGEDAGMRYVCKELITGVNLKQLVKDNGPLAPEDAHEAAIQIAGRPLRHPRGRGHPPRPQDPQHHAGRAGRRAPPGLDSWRGIGIKYAAPTER